MKYFLLLALFIISACSTNYAKWDTTTKVLEGTYLSLHCADWMQTRNADWSKYYETNLILGKKPDTQKVDVYFLATGLLHPLITHMMPEEYRKYWLALTIGLEAFCVGNNLSIGMGFNF